MAQMYTGTEVSLDEVGVHGSELEGHSVELEGTGSGDTVDSGDPEYTVVEGGGLQLEKSIVVAIVLASVMGIWVLRLWSVVSEVIVRIVNCEPSST